jgi:hypothetical protein
LWQEFKAKEDQAGFFRPQEVVLLQPVTPKVEAAAVVVRLALMVHPTLELRVVRLRVGGLAHCPDLQEQALLAAAVVLRQ